MRKTSSTRTFGSFAGMMVLFARLALVLRRTNSKIFESWNMFSAVGFVRDKKVMDDDCIHFSCGTQCDSVELATARLLRAVGRDVA